MDKHERAVEVVRQKTVYWQAQGGALRRLVSGAVPGAVIDNHAEAWEHTLRVLEAVEKLEPWMVEQMDIEVDLCGSEGGLRALWRVVGAHLQAILDAKEGE